MLMDLLAFFTDLSQVYLAKYDTTIIPFLYTGGESIDYK